MLLVQRQGREVFATFLQVAGESCLLQLLQVCLSPFLDSRHLVQVVLMLLHLRLPPVEPDASPFQLAPPLLLHCCVASFTFASFGKIHLGGHEHYGICGQKETWLHCPHVQSPGFNPKFLEVGSLAPSLAPSGAILSHLLQTLRRAKFTWLSHCNHVMEGVF